MKYSVYVVIGFFYLGIEFLVVRTPAAPLDLLSYYLANKQSLHVRSQGLETLTLIGEK